MGAQPHVLQRTMMKQHSKAHRKSAAVQDSSKTLQEFVHHCSRWGQFIPWPTCILGRIDPDIKNTWCLLQDHLSTEEIQKVSRAITIYHHDALPLQKWLHLCCHNIYIMQKLVENDVQRISITNWWRRPAARPSS